MKPPKLFKVVNKQGYGKCFACDRWRFLNIFLHEGTQFNLCRIDYYDYWENVDTLYSDFRWCYP